MRVGPYSGTRSTHGLFDPGQNLVAQTDTDQWGVVARSRPHSLGDLLPIRILRRVHERGEKHERRVLGLDGLDLVRVVIAAEELYGVIVRDEQIDRIRTYGDLLRTLEIGEANCEPGQPV